MLDLSTLNPEQRQAVETTEGALLVLAGAGSGKTRVVVHRIAHLLEKGVLPEAVLAVTFTNKAAAEMRERVGALAHPDAAEKLTVSTFHAFGMQVLRSHIEHLGYGSRFSIFDTQDQTALLKRVLSQVTLAGRDSFDVKRLLSMISVAKNAGLTPETFAAQAKEGDDYHTILSEIWPLYQRGLKAMNAVDFDDLILLPLELLKTKPEVRDALHARYRYVMVDEYQDTSRVQVRLLKSLAGTGNVCVVGDDDQSIYAWRGAEPDNILHFERDFPGATEVKLTRNYRSTGNILAAANATINLNTARRGKDLWTGDGPGEPIQVVMCRDGDGEAEWVVAELERLVRQEGRRHDDFAILFRTNGQSRPFEESLRSAKIPHKIVGGTRFFDRKEVRDGLSWLRLCQNPRDDVSLLRAISSPPRGIGDTTLERLGEVARREGKSLWDTMRRVHEVDVGRAEGAVHAFVDLVERYRHDLRDGKRLGKTALALLEEAEVFDHVRASVKSAAAAEIKASNLGSLVSSLDNYAEREARPSLAAYLARVSLDNRNEDDGDTGKVTLLTLHAAKGLEFPVVFLVGMEEGLLPHEGMQGEPPNLPEERRLAYVGITRARERLYLTRADHRMRRGRAQIRIPSRFLEDLPPGTFEEVDARGTGPITEDDVEAGLAALQALKARMGRRDD